MEERGSDEETRVAAAAGRCFAAYTVAAAAVPRTRDRGAVPGQLIRPKTPPPSSSVRVWCAVRDRAKGRAGGGGAGEAGGETDV